MIIRFCPSKKLQSNLPVSDLITAPKEDKHTRILFQNVNSLELSSDSHTLELTCDVIGQLEIDIACLAEINTHWKHSCEEASLRAATKNINDTPISPLLKPI